MTRPLQSGGAGGRHTVSRLGGQKPDTIADAEIAPFTAQFPERKLQVDRIELGGGSATSHGEEP